MEKLFYISQVLIVKFYYGDMLSFYTSREFSIHNFHRQVTEI